MSFSFIWQTASDDALIAAAQPEVIAVKDVKYKFTGVRQSSYRYISGKPLHPSTNYDHIKDLSLKMSGECDALGVRFYLSLLFLMAR